jgi:hypothetical protein
MKLTKDKCEMLDQRGVRWGWDHDLTFETNRDLSCIPIIDAIEHRAGEVFEEWSLVKRKNCFCYKWHKWVGHCGHETANYRIRLDAALAFAEYFPKNGKEADGYREVGAVNSTCTLNEHLPPGTTLYVKKGEDR